jgi:hypothetical protein
MNAETGFRFPFQTFRSAASFADFVRAQQKLLDLRYGYEQARAASAQGPVMVSAGSCGLCLRATSFSTNLPAADAPSGTQPNWREEMHCGCPHRLNNRFRALLHFLASDVDPPDWARILLLGAAQPIEPYLQRRGGAVSVRARSGRLLRAPRFEAQSYHLILSSEHLHTEPELDAVLAGLRDALMPGGRLMFTAPFDTASAACRPPCGGAGGVLGWDVLKRLTMAGFSAPAAHLFWSEEFGYLGPFNLIFAASA